MRGHVMHVSPLRYRFICFLPTEMWKDRLGGPSARQEFVGLLVKSILPFLKSQRRYSIPVCSF